METSWTRGAGPSPQLLRLLSSTADYALVLLRVVEMMAGGRGRCCSGGTLEGPSWTAGQQDWRAIVSGPGVVTVPEFANECCEQQHECFSSTPVPINTWE